MNLRRASIRGLIWLAIEGGSTLLISAVSLFVMGHLVGPTDFGLAALAIAIVQIIGLFSEFMLQDALVQRDAPTPEHESTAHWASVAIGAAGFLLCVAAAQPLAWLFHAPSFAWILVATAVPLPFTGLIAVPSARLRRAFELRSLVMRTIVSRLCGVVVGPVAALLGLGAWSLVLQHIVGVMGAVVLVLLAAPPRLPPVVRWARLRELVAVGAPMIGAGLGHMLRDRLFLAAVGTVLDVRAAGFVNMTFRLVGTLMDTTISAVNGLNLSTLARHQGDPAALRRAYEELQRVIALLAQPIFLGLFATAGEIVPVVLGDAWGPVVPLMQAMALTAAFQLLVYQSEAVVAAIGRPGFASRFFGATALAVAGLVPAFHPGSPFAALLVWIGVLVAAAPLWIAGVRRLTGWSAAVQLAPGLRGLLCGAAMAAGVLALDQLALSALADAWRLLAKIGAGAVLYAGLALAFDRAELLHVIATLRERRTPPAAS